MNRAGAYQAGADAATAVNALLGVGAIGYTLAGNKLFALLLLVGAIGFDGLDGWLHRRGGGASTQLGRILDSAADSVSFAIAPAFVVAVHSLHQGLWGAYLPLAQVVGLEVGLLAVARLVYFTLRGHRYPHFVGASTPQTTLAIVVLILFFDQPAYLGVSPVAFLLAVALLAPLMVLPVPYPKIRRGAPLRWTMTLVSVALAIALVPSQFVPAPGSALYDVGAVASVAAAVGLAVYYVVGPWTTRGEPPTTPTGATHG